MKHYIAAAIDVFLALFFARLAHVYWDMDFDHTAMLLLIALTWTRAWERTEWS